MQEFPLGQPTIEPHITYKNNLYIYPQVANLASTSGRNICIQVALVPNDEDLQASPLQV
jgi:hypothetical protein